LNIYDYTPGKRDPTFACADKSCLWELNILSQHYHPSVSKWAQFILSNTPINYKGDPLRDFDFSSFLDRIIYKNPKKNPEEKIFDKGGSTMQSRYVRYVDRTLPVNNPQFLQQPEEQVRDDELFFYKYFKYQNKNKKQKKKKKILKKILKKK